MDKLASVFVLALPLFAWAQSPFDSTWKMNLSSTQFAEKPDNFELHNKEYTCSTCIPKIAVEADGSPTKWRATRTMTRSRSSKRNRDGKFLALNEITVHGNTMTVVSKDRRGNTMMSFTADKQ